jgi:hypothetical protein
MNRSKNENKSNRNTTTHASSFSSQHPPGGLIAWPDGSTSKIGDRRRNNPLPKKGPEERKGFVAWPVSTPQALRA